MWQIINQIHSVSGKVQVKLMKGKGTNFPFQCETGSVSQEINNYYG